MKKYLGIDIGGTNVKFGIVSNEGVLLEKVKHKTAKVNKDGKFLENFKNHLKDMLDKNPDIEEVGIGVPGTISLDRMTLLELANIPSLNGTRFISALQEAFPNIVFELENDANAAALGEYHFGELDLPNSYMLVTLGTGVGGAAIIEKKIFKGGKGNGMEIGHILSNGKKTIEDHLGKRGIIRYAQKYIKNTDISSSLRSQPEFDAKKVAKAALDGDKLAQRVYKKLGSKLGECIVAGVRILDVDCIIIGGGVSETFGFMEPNMWKVINESLSPYYTDKLEVKIASLKNEAGIIGAASLCI